jgi:hypothetical protein
MLLQYRGDFILVVTLMPTCLQHGCYFNVGVSSTWTASPQYRYSADLNIDILTSISIFGSRRRAQADGGGRRVGGGGRRVGGGRSIFGGMRLGGRRRLAAWAAAAWAACMPWFLWRASGIYNI